MSYRFMRVIVFFDLPTTTKEDLRAYQKFRTNLLQIGFDMIQYSVYSKICTNKQSADSCILKVSNIAPNNGSIRAIIMTEKQYSSMTVIIGGITNSEKNIKDRRFILIE